MSKEYVSVLTLGCSKNVVDSENLIGILKKNGLEHTYDPNRADHIVINTCGFIKDAKEESIQAIFDAIGLKQNKKLKNLIVTGCLSQRYKQELAEQIPDVDYFFGMNEYANVLQAIKGAGSMDLNYPYLNRHLLTPPHYAYLKISEGCSHGCSFCAIPLIRGRHVSREMEELIDEAKMLVDRGVNEICVIAQDTTYYGMDLYGERKIAELTDKLASVPGLNWLRLMYTYPTGFPLELLDVMASHDNICNYIDIPLQHISDRLLKSMKRGINANKIRGLIANIREKLNDVAIRSAFITGYPGETDKDFRLLLDFIKEYKLDRVGVFTYSHEDNTPAFELEDNIPEELKNERRDILMKAQSEISLEINKSKIGQKPDVIIDGHEDGYYFGRTQQDAPEVDNSVIIQSNDKLKIGDILKIEITGADEYDLTGMVV